MDRWELVLQRDRFEDEPIGEWEPQRTNPEIERHAHVTLEGTLRAARHGASRGTLVALREREPDRPAVWGPSIVWTRAGRILRPRCPVSLGLLSTCRDDALLSARGLPTFTSSSVRFLYSPETARRGEPRFYSADPFPGHAEVFTARDLLADQLRVLARAREVERENPDLAREILAEFQAEDGRAPREGELFILNLHETVAIARRPMPFTLGEAARAVALPEAERKDAKNVPGRLYCEDGSGLDALEVLRLKLALIVQALAAVHSRYLAGAGPHLALSPDAFGVRFAAGGPGAPAFWSVRTELIGLPAAAPLSGSPEPEGFTLLARGAPAFLPDPVFDGRYLSTREAVLAVQGVEEADGTFFVDAALADQDASLPPLSEKDRVRVRTRPGARPIVLDAWGTVRKGADGAPGSLAVRLSVGSKEAAALHGWEGRVPVRYAIFPCLHAPTDLYSMGIVLLAVLVAHEAQPAAALAEALSEWREAAVREAGGGTEEVGRRIAARAEKWLTQSKWAGLFDRRNLFPDPRDRREDRPNAVPPWIWTEVLILALRMSTWVPGFGFCRDHGDFDASYPAGRFEPALAELESILARIDAVLLGRQAANREVRHVIRDLQRRAAR